MENKKEKKMVTVKDKTLNESVHEIFRESMYDFDYGYSKNVGSLNIKMIDRNKAANAIEKLFYEEQIKLLSEVLTSRDTPEDCYNYADNKIYEITNKLNEL